MALVDFCYRCPECGHDPMGGAGDAAWCDSCGVRIERREGRLMMVFSKKTKKSKNFSEKKREFVDIKAEFDTKADSDIKAEEIRKKISEHGGPFTRATRADGTVLYSARAEVCWRISERPVWRRGVLLGFAESMGPKAPGAITVDREGVLVDDGRPASGRWRLLDIRAVQAASKSLQLSLPGDVLVQLGFVDDSPRRWEILMRHLIADAYERAGRGRVVEFQPRIVTG